MTADGLGKTFGYTSENLLTSGSGSVTLAYDPAMRLYQVAGAATTRFGYDGVNLIDEYNGSNALQRRYVFGPGTDEALVWYEGSGTTDRRFLHADERGSIVAVSNGSGSVTNVDTYDEYGKPGSGNVGRFQYTGQKWIVELGLYDYKSRLLHPSLGRFPQPDPIGYGDGPNFYNYAHADPVSRIDPSGLSSGDCFEVVYTQWEAEFMGSTMVTTPRRTGQRTEKICGGGGGPFAFKGPSFAGGNGPKEARPVKSVEPAPVQDECAYRNSSGQCTMRRDESGKLYSDPEYLKIACEGYKAIMKSNREVGALNFSLSAPGTVNAMTGGSVGWLGKVTRIISLPPVVAIRGIAAGATLALAWGGAYSAPEGCH